MFVVVSLTAGGIVIYRLHGVFGTQTGAPTLDRRGETAPNPPKSATYEITGPAGTIGVVSYFDLKKSGRGGP